MQAVGLWAPGYPTKILGASPNPSEHSLAEKTARLGWGRAEGSSLRDPSKTPWVRMRAARQPLGAREQADPARADPLSRKSGLSREGEGTAQLVGPCRGDTAASFLTTLGAGNWAVPRQLRRPGDQPVASSCKKKGKKEFPAKEGLRNPSKKPGDPTRSPVQSPAWAAPAPRACTEMPSPPRPPDLITNQEGQL